MVTIMRASFQRLHMGNSNPIHSYTMSNVPLTTTAEEKDLGVIMDTELKLHKHTAYALKKASKMIGLFRDFYGNGETPFRIWE